MFKGLMSKGLLRCAMVQALCCRPFVAENGILFRFKQYEIFFDGQSVIGAGYYRSGLIFSRQRHSFSVPYHIHFNTAVNRSSGTSRESSNKADVKELLKQPSSHYLQSFRPKAAPLHVIKIFLQCSPRNNGIQ